MKHYLKEFLAVVKTLGTETDEVKDKIILIAMLDIFENGRTSCDVLTDVSNEIIRKECDRLSES